ncbi:APC family permease [Sporosarcina jiandibaonis]|uniref:APC family permease n=1 Tax=Sporosarcina jiandibaonis TaxID=2715535 RepID=UPI001554C13C|nr:APC family permease [Sporosarcina jiandibaonis]
MGKRETLNKNLKPGWVWAIAFGSSIGWGAFILPADWIGQSGPMGAIIGMLLGALVMIIIAVSYGVLIKKHPVSGGEYAYAFISAGKYWAFITGWFLSLGYICIVALNASAFSLLLKYLFPGFMKYIYLYEIAGWEVFLPEVVISSIAILFFAFLNIKGSGISGRLQYIFSILLIVGVAIMGTYTFIYADMPISNMKPMFVENQSILTSIIVILAIAPWAYVGFDNVPQAAEEFKFSPQKAFGLIVMSLIASGLVYATMIGVTSWTYASDKVLDSSNLWLTGDIINSSFGLIGVIILALAISMGIFTGLNGFFHSSSRLLFAMSRAKAIPSMFSDLHPVHKTPYKSIWFIAVLTLPSVWFGREALLWIVDMSSTGVSVAYFFTCFTSYKLLAWSKNNHGLDVEPVKKGIAFVGSIFSIGFLMLLLVPGSPAQLQLPSIIALFVWIVLGFVFLMIMFKNYKEYSEDDLKYFILGQEKENV